MKSKVIPVFIAMLAVFASSGARALDMDKNLQSPAIGAAVGESSAQINDFLNTLALNHGMSLTSQTRVVPVINVGSKGYIGAAQIVGLTGDTSRVQSVIQYEDTYGNGKYRVMLMFPSGTLNPYELERAPGVGLSGLVDVSMAGGAPGLVSGGVHTFDATKSTVMGEAVRFDAKGINKFINSDYKKLNMESSFATRVVPRINVAENSYVGGVQIMGTKEDVNRVQAVFEFSDVFDNAKYSADVLVPGDTTETSSFHRVYGISITAVVDVAADDLYPVSYYPYYAWRTDRPSYTYWDQRPYRYPYGYYGFGYPNHDNGRHGYGGHRGGGWGHGGGRGYGHRH